MSVKISAAFPKGEHNGLAGQEARLESIGTDLVPVVMLCEVSEIGRVLATDEETVKLRIAEIEIVGGDTARELLRAARKDRTGVAELDFDGLDGAGIEGGADDE